MATTADHGSLVVSSNLTSIMNSLPKEKVSSLVSTIRKMLLDSRNLNQTACGGASTRKIRSVPVGESIMRLRFGRWLVNLLLLAQLTKPFTFERDHWAYLCHITPGDNIFRTTNKLTLDRWDPEYATQSTRANKSQQKDSFLELLNLEYNIKYGYMMICLRTRTSIVSNTWYPVWF